jgi:hypothetical protein
MAKKLITGNLMRTIKFSNLFQRTSGARRRARAIKRLGQQPQMALPSPSRPMFPRRTVITDDPSAPKPRKVVAPKINPNKKIKT